MLLLHLSDLHFGAHSRFQGEDLTKLGKAFFKDLEAARGSFAKGSRIDLVAVTGDVAESGKPAEFKQGEVFLAALAGELGLDRRRFVFVPGNHDVSWPACKKVAADQEEEGFDEAELRKRLDAVKLGRYEEFLRSFYGVKDLAEVALPLGRGAFLYDFSDLHLSVAALSSCEKESHRPADHVGLLSREQAEVLMAEWRVPERASLLKIVTVHHNPVVTVPANLAEWRKEIEKKGLAPELAARYEGDVIGFEGREYLKAIVEDSHAQLILHGHHHAKDEQSWDWRRGAKGRAAVLSAGSLTLKADKLPEDEPLSIRLVELDTGKKEIRARSLIYDPRGRTEGEVRLGAFISDPVEPQGYRQHLDLPPGFEPKKSKATKNKTPSKAAAFVRAYRQSLAASFSRWDLAPVGVAQAGGAGRPIEAGLDEMYQPLRLTEGFNIRKTDQGMPIPPEDLLVRSRPLAIRGAAGAGKTTWMRWTFRRLLSEERALPLMLVVRDLARHWQSPNSRGAERSLVSFLDAWAAERMGSGWEGELRKALEAGDGPRPILLVDGWDEAGKLGEELREKLVGLLTKCPRMLAVVTSRPYGQGRPSHAEGFDVLDVQPLADGEIQAFARRFFRQCYGEDEVAAVREAERFWSALERAPEPQALARTALLLTMMLLISRSRPLPDKRHLLYEACIDNLLTALPDRKAEEGALLSYEQWRPEDSEARKRVVAALAFFLQDEGYKGNMRSPIVRNWDGMMVLLPSSWTTKQRRSFLAWLAGPAGLLTDRADGTLAFTHLSFQEYLTAWHLNATIEGAEERIREFARQKKIIWWETLRLWAALIEKQSPDRLDPVLEALMSSGSDGLALVGKVLADGLGNDRRFEEWDERWRSELLGNWIREANQCALSWAASLQEARKQTLARGCLELAPGVSWLAWIRLRDFLQGMSISGVPSLPKSLVSRSILEQLEGDAVPCTHSVAAGRVLCSGPAIWPIEPLALGLLQVWPGERRLLGLRLQAAVVAGMTRTEMKQVLRLWPQRRSWTKNELDFIRNFVRNFVRRVVGYFGHDLGYDLGYGLGRDCARDFAGNFVRHLTCDSDFHIDDYDVRHLVLNVVSYVSRYLSHNFARNLARGLTRELARDLPGNSNTRIPESFARDEMLSWGRVGARSILAYQRTENPIPEVQLLSAACRLSLHPTLDSKELDKTLARHEAELDPLWLALSRHLARRATPADHALLTDLAQHPEKRDSPLAWGLQFIVRGMSCSTTAPSPPWTICVTRLGSRGFPTWRICRRSWSWNGTARRSDLLPGDEESGRGPPVSPFLDTPPPAGRIRPAHGERSPLVVSTKVKALKP
ncbi:MAG: hypothetical protein QOF89_2767 [Acidobacteriota bacterium]|jgi:predicted MPP superfamily phosphohydrolase|nr:hypothetical protein [Acidobacteriota bacterium]